MCYTFQKDAGKNDFVSAVQRQNAIKLGPSHYKIADIGGFTSKENLRKIRFAFNKD